MREVNEGRLCQAAYTLLFIYFFTYSITKLSVAFYSVAFYALVLFQQCRDSIPTEFTIYLFLQSPRKLRDEQRSNLATGFCKMTKTVAKVDVTCPETE